MYLGFGELELSKLLMFEAYYDKLQPYFGQENLHLHFMDIESFVLSVNTKKIIKELKNLEEFFDFSNLKENHDIFSKENKKLSVNIKEKLQKAFGLINLFV